eukprot:3655698-Prymnesium_polylepis.1
MRLRSLLSASGTRRRTLSPDWTAMRMAVWSFSPPRDRPSAIGLCRYRWRRCGRLLRTACL